MKTKANPLLCVSAPGTASGFHPRLMPALAVACPAVEDIDALQVRIAKAEAERDAWRASGVQEKYLEAYTLVEALELQLHQLRRLAPPHFS